MKSLEILFLKSASALSHSRSAPTPVPPAPQGRGSIPVPGPEQLHVPLPGEVAGSLGKQWGSAGREEGEALQGGGGKSLK